MFKALKHLAISNANFYNAPKDFLSAIVKPLKTIVLKNCVLTGLHGSKEAMLANLQNL